MKTVVLGTIKGVRDFQTFILFPDHAGLGIPDTILIL